MKIKLNRKKKLSSLVDINITNIWWNFFLHSFVEELPTVYMPNLKRVPDSGFWYYCTDWIFSKTHPK